MSGEPVLTGKDLLSRFAMMFGAMAIALIALVLIGRALYLSEHVTFVAGDRTYRISAASVSSHRQQPHLFVRLRPENMPFEIVYDASLEERSNARRHPVVFSVNSDGDHHVLHLQQGGVTLVCRRASNPVGGCGAALQHAGATWSVLFPESRARQAPDLLRRAVQLLEGYAAGRPQQTLKSV